MLLDALKLSQNLLELFLALVMQKHDSLLPFKDSSQESSPSTDHFPDFGGFLAPLVNKLRQGSHVRLQGCPGTKGPEELENLDSGTFHISVIGHLCVKVYVLLSH